MSKKKDLSKELSAQRKRLLEALRNASSEGVTTIQAREELDIMAPAARVYELRHDYNLNIQLISDHDTNAQGHRHQCARYVLFSGKWKGVKAA